MNTPRSVAFVPIAINAPGSNKSRSLRFPLVLSALVHALAVAVVVIISLQKLPDRPPAYRVELLGAAGMKKQMGVVAPQPIVEPPPSNAPAPKSAETIAPKTKALPPPKAKTKPVPKPKLATPSPTKSATAGAAAPTKPAEKAPPPPTAGSGSKTGKGTDITNMVADGIVFPYPGYLDQISRQVVLRFDRPQGNTLEPLVKFLIHRDGSITDITIVTSSGSRALDREAIGAVEATGTTRAIGPLPRDFPDDVLPVYYTFSPAKTPSLNQ